MREGNIPVPVPVRPRDKGGGNPWGPIIFFTSRETNPFTVLYYMYSTVWPVRSPRRRSSAVASVA